MAKPVYIPIDDDLAVYARAVDSFFSYRSQINYAVVLLAQRVVLERIKCQRKSRRRSAVLHQIDRINTDPVYRARIASEHGLDDSALVQMFPGYVQAGLTKG